MDDGAGNLYDRALRAIADRPLNEIVARTRAIVGPRLENLEGEAHDGLEALKRGNWPTSQQVAALQAIIRAMRPSALSHNGSVDALPAEANPVFPDWKTFTDLIGSHLNTIGRVDRKGEGPLPPDPFGTGFLVGPGLFLTNHHVITLLTAGTDLLNPGEAEVRFLQEYSSPDEPAVSVVEIQELCANEDAALLKLDTSQGLDQRARLNWSETDPRTSDHVVVIGYPFLDTKRNPLFLDAIFGAKLGVKRLAPGEIIAQRGGVIYHDCSTLGGNSGSPVVSMKSGEVVALHREGYFLARNEAVSAAALRHFLKV